MCTRNADGNTATVRGAVEELTNLALRGENNYVREWKQAGNKVVGFTCSYVPEEILYAGNKTSKVLPFRMGAEQCESTEDADIYLHKFACGYVKCLLQLGLSGQYDFLDGAVWSSTCEQMRRSYELWCDQVKLDYFEMLSVPHSTEGERRLTWYRDEIEKIAKGIDGCFGRSVSEEELRESIRTYNRFRKLMLELYELRELVAPKLTGAEAMKIAQAGFSMPKEQFNDMLSAALAELEARPGISDYNARIMVCGSYLDDTFLLDLIEESGAIVVTDNLCTGRKYIEGLVDEMADPLDALAQRYLNHVSCPRMVGDYPKRLAFTKKLIQEARVDGVIFQRLPFCDNHAVENVMESKAVEEDGIPVLNLEKEYLAADKGRLKTRIQAFLEKIAD
ncbi:MAG: 2-hydroxyacyl-CoA dehydratase [Deltaproteobacteria bacterium]|nr:2-hydroxyacyl-CoA dehydratase [Deltaproteobacteria bacterium]